MVQRQQTLWLILALICAALTFKFSFVIGNDPTNGVREDVTAGSNFVILIVTVAICVVAAITIFMFKDRKSQTWLSLLGLVLAIVTLVLYFLQMQKLTNTTLSLGCVLPVVTMASFFMAIKGIRKDEKLVKSLDKLR